MGQPVSWTVLYCPEVNGVGIWPPIQQQPWTPLSLPLQVRQIYSQLTTDLQFSIYLQDAWFLGQRCWEHQRFVLDPAFIAKEGLVASDSFWSHLLCGIHKVSVRSQWKYHWGYINIANSRVNKCHIRKWEGIFSARSEAMWKMHLINEIHFCLNGSFIIIWQSICVLFLLGKYLQLSFLGYISEDLLSAWPLSQTAWQELLEDICSLHPVWRWEQQTKATSSQQKVRAWGLTPSLFVNHGSIKEMHWCK